MEKLIVIYSDAVAAHASKDGRNIVSFSTLKEGGSYETVKVHGFRSLTWDNKKSGEAMKSFGAECDVKRTLSDSGKVFKRIFCSINSDEFPELTVNSVLAIDATDFEGKVYPKVIGILS